MLQSEVAVRILLVEDHPQLAESVAQALKGAGWTVDLLHDGVAADLALASEDYALAILDIGLPRLDGFAVLARARDRGQTLPVLVIAGEHDPALGAETCKATWLARSLRCTRSASAFAAGSPDKIDGAAAGAMGAEIGASVS